MLLKTERLTIRHIVEEDWKSIKELQLYHWTKAYSDEELEHWKE